MPTVTNHGAVTVAVFATAVANVSMKLLHQLLGVDFGGMEPDIITMAVFCAYMVNPKEGA